MSVFYTASQRTVAAESWRYWLSVGYDEDGAASWLGDEDGESSFCLGVIGDHGEAFDPFQHHAARIDLIKAGCNIDMRTASHIDQLRGADWETTHGTYHRVRPAIIAADGIPAKIAVLVSKFEQSGQQPRDIARRTILATYWRQQFGVAA